MQQSILDDRPSSNDVQQHAIHPHNMKVSSREKPNEPPRIKNAVLGALLNHQLRGSRYEDTDDATLQLGMTT